MSDAPSLAVVGHPNKGKSSLVATLSRDDSVAIGAHPGTTQRARDYPMRIDGELLYSLVDTPGFQRARQVLAWLQERFAAEGASAADRPRIVRAFAEAPEMADRFPDETELLRPIVAGAGILYVVDGGVPYGPEYEAEMEILRWCGAPSMAIINPIGNADHVDEWQAALSQYFRAVRVINAATADYSTRRQLLLAFGEIETSWRAPVDRAVAALDAAESARRHAAAREIGELIAEALGFVAERKVASGAEPEALREDLEAEYKRALQRLEQDRRQAVQRLYDHYALEANEPAFEILEEDLFSEGTWLTFGLSRRDLAAAGAASGAATGVAVDVVLHGASLLLGMAAGAAIGGALGWFGAGRLAELKVVNQPLGGRLARFGPSKNLNFPFVLLGRARYHWSVVERRTHAMRDPIELSGEGASMPLPAESRKAAEKIFAKLRKAGLGSAERAERTDQLVDLVETLLAADALATRPAP